MRPPLPALPVPAAIRTENTAANDEYADPITDPVAQAGVVMGVNVEAHAEDLADNGRVEKEAVDDAEEEAVALFGHAQRRTGIQAEYRQQE